VTIRAILRDHPPDHDHGTPGGGQHDCGPDAPRDINKTSTSQACLDVPQGNLFQS